jgi:hypothetical protein
LPRKNFVQEIVVVTAQVDHFGIGARQPFYDQFKEFGMFLLPPASFPELPPIDDIAVQDKFFASVMAKKMYHFTYS